MGIRVTADQVKTLIDTERDIQSMLVTANTVVEEAYSGETISEALLTQVELYLAAHFVALTEESGSLLRDSIGESATTLANVYGQGLASTRYGQSALAIDPTGSLANFGNAKPKAEFRVY